MRDPEHTIWRFGSGSPNAQRYAHHLELRECLGWPEVGECGRSALRSSRYCASCDEARTAHRDEDEKGDCDG